MKNASSYIAGLGLNNLQPSIEKIGTRTKSGFTKPIIGQLITLTKENRDHLFTSLDIDKEAFLNNMKRLVKFQTNTYKVLETLAYKYLTPSTPNLTLQLGEENFGCQFICKWNTDKKIVTFSRNCNQSGLFRSFSFTQDKVTKHFRLPPVYNTSDEVYGWQDDFVSDVAYEFPLMKSETEHTFKGDSSIILKQLGSEHPASDKSFAKTIKYNETLAKTFYMLGIHYSNVENCDVKIICPIDNDLEFNFKFYGKRVDVARLQGMDIHDLPFDSTSLSHSISYCQDSCFTEITKMMENLTIYYDQMLLDRVDEDKTHNFPIKIKLKDGSTSYIQNIEQLLATTGEEITIINFS